VRGEVQEASFYFDPNEPKASQALDYLLMTQGWRRFTWHDVRRMDRTIVYMPEKIKNLSGTIMRNGIGMQSDITLLELGNKRRIEKIQTTATGRFLFKNIDPTVPILLIAKKPGEIIVQKEESTTIVHNGDNNNLHFFGEIDKEKEVATAQVPADGEDANSSPDLNMTMDEDVASLAEVVVTGFGYEDKRYLAASIVTVSEQDVLGKFSTHSPASLLQGRVGGIVVESQSINPSNRTPMLIRGHSSFAMAAGEPLYVIDGFPLDASLNPNFSNMGIVGQDDIQSIEVIPSPEATSIYGSLAANGAILITTKSRIGYMPFVTKHRVAKYNTQTINPRSFSATREFYVAPPWKAASARREDFRTTLYWNHTIVTNDRGEAELSFYNNDAVSSFRLTAEGVSANGLIGRVEQTYFTQLPFSLDTKFPAFLGFEDTLKLPIRITNETTSILHARVTIAIPPQLRIWESPVQDIQVDTAATKTLFYTITPKAVAGDFPVAITLQAPDYQDKIEQTIRIQPVGFPAGASVSARDTSKTLRVSIDEAELGTLKGEFVAFPDVISDLLTGAEAILREPHGCFEQVSSSTFPNILVLQLLKESGTIRPDVEKRAMQYISSGYRKLSGYEVAGGGFDWFGHPPASEGLTAFGLIEFHEMKKVFKGVDDKMVERAREWLLNRRDGLGGFKTQHNFFGGAAVENAYITFALAETGVKNIEREYEAAFHEALKSEDWYRMALVACASRSLGKTDDYNKLIDIFKTKVASEGLSGLRAHHSFVYSYGESLSIETISLWTIALLKSTPLDHNLVANCIEYIVGHRRYGRFGSTQGTTLALKALTEYAKLVRSQQGDGTIQISVDNNVSERVEYKKEIRDKIVLNKFVKDLHNNDKHDVHVKFIGKKEPLPYSINISWFTKKPQSNDSCKVALATHLGTASVRVNETVRLIISIRNKTNNHLPMTTAVVGIPAGLSLQPWQLKELQEKKVFDFYEIQNGNLIVYYRQLKPAAVQHVNLDLKAELPGSYTGAASTVYLYYTDEYKDWVRGNSILVYQ
jgi:TonB-dependent SusC/RagA subfamily outer membrane receptor